MGLDLLSMFVLTLVLLLQRKTQTSLLRISSRRSLSHPTLPVVLAFAECFRCHLVPIAAQSLTGRQLGSVSLLVCFSFGCGLPARSFESCTVYQPYVE